MRPIVSVNTNRFEYNIGLYKISQDQELFKQTINELAKTEVSPLASRIDWEASVSEELLQKLAAAGLFGIIIPQEYGGAGADFLSLILSAEELSKVSGSLGAQISFHNGVVCGALMASANETLKQKLLPKLAAGTLGAFSLDPNSTVKCVIENGWVILNGSSEYVMSASRAGVFLVLAKFGKESVLICFEKNETKETLFSVGEEKKLLGMRASGTASISFRDLRLTEESLLFASAATDQAAGKLLVLARLAVASQALGLGQASLDAAIAYSKERSQFNTKIANFYAIRDFIAQDQIAIQSARSITYSTASELSSAAAARDSAIAKVSSSNAAVQAARHSIRIHGGYGFVRDYPVERYLRDARATQIYVESNEALKDKIAASVLS